MRSAQQYTKNPVQRLAAIWADITYAQTRFIELNRPGRSVSPESK